VTGCCADVDGGGPIVDAGGGGGVGVDDGGRAFVGGGGGGGGTTLVDDSGQELPGLDSQKRGEQLLGGSVLAQVVHHALLPSGLVWQHLTVRSPKFSHVYPNTMLDLENELYSNARIKNDITTKVAASLLVDIVHC
jgi:hypothetical protein